MVPGEPSLNKKHILFIASWYPNRNNPTHGIFNHYMARAAALYDTISVLHVSSDSLTNSDFEIVEHSVDGIRTINVYYQKIKHKIPFVSQLFKRKRLIKAFELGYEKLNNSVGQPDLIQLNVVMPAGIGAFYLSEKYKIPFVISEHWSGYFPEDGNYKGFPLKLFTKKIINAASLIMPVSANLKDAMISHHLLGDYQIVPDVVDVDLFKPADSISKGKIKFIHISSLTDREKNLSGILRAFKKALMQNKNIALSVVGDGPEREQHEAYCMELNINNDVIFKGLLTGETLVNEINGHDALVMFSNFETFGLVVMEVMACGKPVISSNTGALLDFMKPGYGFMVEKNNESELSRAILSFASNPKTCSSSEIRQAIVERFSYQKVGRQLSGIYNQILNKKAED